MAFCIDSVSSVFTLKIPTSALQIPGWCT